MGYHVSILRTSGHQQIPLTENEVKEAIATLSDFCFGFDVNHDPIVEIKKGDQPYPCLWLQKGELWTKNPDDETIDKMCELADVLNARVRGDEMETYKSSQEAYDHPDDSVFHKAAEKSLKTHRHRELVWNCIRIAAVIYLAYVLIQRFLLQS